MKFNAKATIALTALLLVFCSILIRATSAQQAQPSPLLPPQPVPPLSDKQKAAVQQLIQQGIAADQGLDDRIEAKVNNTFGWTMTLINFLIIVLIAFPIVIAIVAWALRRSVITELVNETRKQFREETEAEAKQQLEQQVATELQKQIDIFKQELQRQTADLAAQLQQSFIAAQQKKEQIFYELTQITPTAVQEEFVAADIQKRIQALTEQLQQLKSENPQLYLTVDDYLRQGDAFYIEQRYEDALAAYEAAIGVQPDRQSAWMGKARVLRQLKHHEDALAANHRAIELNPRVQPAWFGKALTLMNMQRYVEALKCFNKAIKLEPERSNSWRFRGYVLTKLGRYSEALASLEKATKLSSNSGGIYYNKAYLYTTKGDSDQAILELKQAIELNSKFRELLRTDADFDSLRKDDRFQALIQE